MNVFLSGIESAVKSIINSIYSIEQSEILVPHNQAVFITAIQDALLADKANVDDDLTWKRISEERWNKAK
ncbi:hypothetical protein [Bacillus paranthracis]|uniref:hypothetical protein n=1 Tax=Bacillus paranthracis TaxID=2026186 RepID=UPI002813FEA8|nr:hypothetical protein [Bacillus paranthracis]MDR0170889.1 hypothetical protein [Bacillus paranthracis]